MDDSLLTTFIGTAWDCISRLSQLPFVGLMGFIYPRCLSGGSSLKALFNSITDVSLGSIYLEIPYLSCFVSQIMKS